MIKSSEIKATQQAESEPPQGAMHSSVLFDDMEKTARICKAAFQRMKAIQSFVKQILGTEIKVL